MRFTILACATALLALSTNLQAQDEAPSTLAISYYQCDWPTAMQWVSDMDSLVQPVWQELVDEGMSAGWGVLVHDFAGYENVIIWRAGPSLADIEAAQDEAFRRIAERHPDAPAASCSKHRDGIYTIGPGTGPNKPGYGTFVVSYNACDSNMREAIAASIDSLIVPTAQEMVDEGKFGQWGILVHDWAGRENIINYRSAKDRTSFFEAWQELNRRVSEKHPDADPYLGCNQHRDGLYNEGPRTYPPAPEMPAEEEMEEEM